MKKHSLPEFSEFAQNIQPLLENYLLDNVMKPRVDQWEKHAYIGFRYLDTLARIFDVKPKNPCTSVVPLKTSTKAAFKIAIAFNSDATQQNISDIKKIAGLLQYSIQNKNYLASFIAEVFSKSQCYIHCISKIQEKLKLHELDNINNTLIKGTYIEIEKLIRLINNKDSQSILGQYELTLTKLGLLLKEDFNSDPESLKVTQDLFDKKTIQMLLRPYQDIIKIINFSHEQGKQFIEYELINNTNGAHAELAASSFYFHKYQTKSKYLGISKLSCYLCDLILSKEDQGHRGTHGILYVKDYKLPSQYEEPTVKEFLVSNLQSYLENTIFSKPEEHILNTTLLNKGKGKLINFLEYYEKYNPQENRLTNFIDKLPSRDDLDQFHNLSFDKDIENSILGNIKEDIF